MMWPVFICLIMAVVTVFGDNCMLINMDSSGKEIPVTPADDHYAYNKLKPLIGKRYSATDIKGEYSYTVGICHPAGDGASYKNIAVVQHNLHPKSGGKLEYVVGTYNQTQLMAGNDWIMIEYWGGEPYGHHCSQEPRKANILLICNPDADDENPGMKVLEEQNGKSSDCYYLFELSHKAVCGEKVVLKNSLSAGSILLIVLACVVALYLILGFLYQRFVLHAKGMEQIPNYHFWKDFGNLQADGCNLVCRSTSNRSVPYKGIGDEQLEEDFDRTDDHLLPM